MVDYSDAADILSCQQDNRYVHTSTQLLPDTVDSFDGTSFTKWIL